MIRLFGNRQLRHRLWLAEATARSLELASRCPDIDEVLRFWANAICDSVVGLRVALFVVEGDRWLRILPEKQAGDPPFLTESLLATALGAQEAVRIRPVAPREPDTLLVQYAGRHSWRGLLALWKSGGFTRDRIREAEEIATAIGRCLTLLRKSELSREQAIAFERSRWAAELHDGHLQTLSSAKLHAEVCASLGKEHEEVCLTLDSSRASSGRISNELGRLVELLSDTVREARQFLLELRSPPVSAEQFLPWLRSYADDFSRETGVRVAMRVEGEGEMPQSQVEEATRLVREALTNVRKHAKAGAVRVVVAFSEQTTSISISDDGVGFDVRTTMEELLDSSHNGLIGIRYRTESVGGEMRLRSEVGRGTSLLFRFPRAGRKASADDTRRRRPPTPASRPSPEPAPAVRSLQDTSIRDSIRETLADAITSFLEQESSAPPSAKTGDAER